jgi:hypothetical protein
MSRKKKLAILAGALVVLLAVGVAFATWTATGTGSGRAKAVTAQTVTVTASTGTADLYPGFTSGNVYFTLTNPNPYGIDFTSFTSGTVTSADPTNCPASNVSVVASGSISPTVHVNAGESPSSQKSITGIVSMLLAAPNGCQGVSFDIVLTLSGQST